MKKLLAILVILALVPGCAFLKNLNDAAAPICNPTPEQKATAVLMLAAIDAAQAVIANFYPPAAIMKASAVLTTIKNGGCFLLAELAEAFQVVDAANTTVAMAPPKGYWFAVPPPAAKPLPEYAPLRSLIKK